MRSKDWLSIGAVAFVLCIVAAPGLAQGPVQHTINVSVRAGSPCSLSTDLPNDRLRARPGDRIVLQVAGNIPNSCGVADGARPGMADFKMNGQAVAPPVANNDGVYVVNNGRNGLYKFSVVLGRLVLDPELEIN
ncbi:MAG: hypothetical protein RJA55_2993 [Acidobacteriota bacterium]|jgi:hypothetical protein